MKCPFCGHLESKVTDSRAATEGDVIRRRRECEKCERRFTTYERVEAVLPLVVKKDGRREVFDRPKIVAGLKKACERSLVVSASPSFGDNPDLDHTRLLVDAIRDLEHPMLPHALARCGVAIRAQLTAALWLCLLFQAQEQKRQHSALRSVALVKLSQNRLHLVRNEDAIFRRAHSGPCAAGSCGP